MADVTVKILVPADETDLISLDELKVALGLPTGVGATDPQLEWLIDVGSSTISTLCNRVFAKEKVQETWRCLGSRRVYLTHWPVKEADVESVTTNGKDRIDYELEEGSGKLSIFTAREEPIIVTYTGGYVCPDEVPDALKQACALIVSTSKAEQAAAALTGVKMIAHKEARVMFHTPTSGSSTGGGGGASSNTRQTVEGLLGHYIRHWI
ncbi:hypothetical protein KIP88_02770 [Bradyrhizobium sp. SRL28]|uniref:hypothetical protein n=1 Tax=Bradyrhizobium sp. SRL28 TaxID=2836178 RepID=UPI001BDE2941|nr:hypothetical protein [Bradyrhizobium sp. SRL28]MBT1509414.1 hypothetical protein [Bradyrhizobium sp. SRL28]